MAQSCTVAIAIQNGRVFCGRRANSDTNTVHYHLSHLTGFVSKTTNIY